MKTKESLKITTNLSNNKLLDSDSQYDLLLNRSLDLYNMKNYNESLSVIRQVKAYKNTAFAFSLESLNYWSLNNHKEAIKSISCALTIEKNIEYIRYATYLIHEEPIDKDLIDLKDIVKTRIIDRVTSNSFQSYFNEPIDFQVSFLLDTYRQLEITIHCIESLIHKTNKKKHDMLKLILSFFYHLKGEMDYSDLLVYDLTMKYHDFSDYYKYIELPFNTRISDYFYYLCNVKFVWLFDMLFCIAENKYSSDCYDLYSKVNWDKVSLILNGKISEYDEEYIKMTTRLTHLISYLNDNPRKTDIHYLHIIILNNMLDILSSIYSIRKHEQKTKCDIIEEKERNRIMANLSHSILNSLVSVSKPLEIMKTEIPEKSKIIDDAIRGTKLIREIVTAINFSYMTTLEDVAYDIKHNNKDSVILNEMIINSIKYSIGNMFDDKHFPAFMQNYYPKKEIYKAAFSVWNKLSGTDSIKAISEFTSEHMFKLQYKVSSVGDYQIGNEKSSAIKLIILFQEVIFNAVKYCSYVPGKDRHIEIDLCDNADKICFKVANSFNPKVQPKSTGVGKLVIDNFARVLGCEPLITTDNNIYTITLEFKDYWRYNE